ncbi:hypothetical protein ACFWRB_25920, partial [Streptomyces bacillaris]
MRRVAGNAARDRVRRGGGRAPRAAGVPMAVASGSSRAAIGAVLAGGIAGALGLLVVGRVGGRGLAVAVVGLS